MSSPDTNIYLNEALARLYDIQYDSSSSDVPFYLELAQKAGGDILELACGTGRLLIPILQMGYPIEGLDLSPVMLARLKEKLAALNLSTGIHHQSMTDFHLEKRYRLIMLPVCSLLLLQSQDEQIKCLERCREHLAEGGKVALDFEINTFDIPANKSKNRHFFKELRDGERSVHVFRVVRIDAVKQRSYHTYYYEFYSPDGRFEEMLTARLDFRWVNAEEFMLMAKTAGFAHVRTGGDYRMEPLHADSKHLVAILEKINKGGTSLYW